MHLNNALFRDRNNVPQVFDERSVIAFAREEMKTDKVMAS